MSATSLRVATVFFMAGCSLFSDPGDARRTAPEPRGMIVGFVRDGTGRGVANTAVCATAVIIDRFGTPLVLVSHGSTNRNGAYSISIHLGVQADTRAEFTVAATPPATTGLAPGVRSGLSVLISAQPPPAETTHAVVQVVQGTPYDGVFCTHGS